MDEADSSASECWVCYSNEDLENLICPCNCRGSLQWVHQRCLRKWLSMRCSNSFQNFDDNVSCPHCNFKLKIEASHTPFSKMFSSLLLGKGSFQPLRDRFLSLVSILILQFTFIFSVFFAAFTFLQIYIYQGPGPLVHKTFPLSQAQKGDSNILWSVPRSKLSFSFLTDSPDFRNHHQSYSPSVEELLTFTRSDQINFFQKVMFDKNDFDFPVSSRNTKKRMRSMFSQGVFLSLPSSLNKAFFPLHLSKSLLETTHLSCASFFPPDATSTTTRAKQDDPISSVYGSIMSRLLSPSIPPSLLTEFYRCALGLPFSAPPTSAASLLNYKNQRVQNTKSSYYSNYASNENDSLLSVPHPANVSVLWSWLYKRLQTLHLLYFLFFAVSVVFFFLQLRFNALLMIDKSFSMR
eukprot:GDKK01031336.1.p1 GENE.GDKK01031336.1~~GDKK01031336.1.p1  ORF type:complete len:407 (+),score=48.35 GDKK01031336.1:40-1260(+)